MSKGPRRGVGASRRPETCTAASRCESGPGLLRRSVRPLQARVIGGPTHSSDQSRAVHPKAMPVILTREEDGLLQIVARGAKWDVASVG